MRKFRMLVAGVCTASMISLVALVESGVSQAAGPTVNIVATTTKTDPVRLHTGKGHFLDSRGRVVLLHGLNLNADVFQYPDTNEHPLGFTEKDADFLLEQGFNFARLAINWAQLVPNRPADPTNFTIDPVALDKIQRVADLLAERKIFFMLDFHQGCWHQWPEWAIPWDKVGGKETAITDFPHCHLVPSGTTKAFDNLFKDPVDPDNPLLPGGSSAVIPVAEVWAAFREAWRQVALRFRDTDYLLGYNFINEPGTSHNLECNVPPVGCPLTEEKIQVFEENALAGIREVDSEGLAVFEPPNLSGTSGAATGFGNMPVTDPGAVWSFHVYCGNFEQPVPDTRLCKELMRPAFEGVAGLGGSTRNAAHLTGADRIRDREPAPQLMSEFGSSVNPTVIDDTLDHADPRFISWAYWMYKGFDDAWRVGLFANKEDEECVCFRTHSPRADVLIRPYAQATAGTPTAYSFNDASGVLTYGYRPLADRSLATRIVVPRYYAPRGYTVEVTNGRVISGDDAMYLKVLATSDARVTVVVKPA